MGNKIGASFYDELLAYGGLIGQHFSWQVETGKLEFFEDTPEEVKVAVEEVLSSHDPRKPSLSEQFQILSDEINIRLKDVTKALEDLSDLLVVADTEEERVELSGKIKSLTLYKIGVKGVTEQEGFPFNVSWPEQVS